MPTNHISTSRQALFSVFVRPLLPSAPSEPYCMRVHRLRRTHLQSSSHRHISVYAKVKPTGLSAAALRNPASVLDPGKTILDEAIGTRSAHLVDPDGSFQAPQMLSQLLRNIDRAKEHLRKVGETAEGIPVVKVVTREVLREEAKNKIKLQKRPTPEDTSKHVELNWAITENDLSYRLTRIANFLREGRRVEILIAPKRGGRKANKEEIDELLRRVREAIKEVEGGAEEWKDMNGKVGAQVTLYVEPSQGIKGRGEKAKKKEDGKEDRLEKKEREKLEKKEKLERRLAKKREEEEREERERKEKLNLDV